MGLKVWLILMCGMCEVLYFLNSKQLIKNFQNHWSIQRCSIYGYFSTFASVLISVVSEAKSILPQLGGRMIILRLLLWPGFLHFLPLTQCMPFPSQNILQLNGKGQNQKGSQTSTGNGQFPLEYQDSLHQGYKRKKCNYFIFFQNQNQEYVRFENDTQRFTAQCQCSPWGGTAKIRLALFTKNACLIHINILWWAVTIQGVGEGGEQLTSTPVPDCCLRRSTKLASWMG